MPRPDHATPPPAPTANHTPVIPWASCRNCKNPILRTDTYYDLDGIRPVCAKCCELRREAGRRT